MKTASSGLVSIIIPLHVVCERFFIDIQKFSRMKYKNYELLVISDISVPLSDILKAKLVLTGKMHTGPAQKRDIGLRNSKGEYCAFIDDDAFPDPYWLTHAIIQFRNNQEIVAVGGPGITPPHEKYMAKLGGFVYESKVTSGLAQYRFVSKGQQLRYTEDYPAYNLLVRTDVLKKVNGYDCTFYGGEDTFLCLKLIQYGKILYDPNVIVYHHRRPIFVPHLKQIYNVGVHRGYFFRKFPKTSRKLFYIFPTVLTIGFFSSLVLSIMYPFVMPYFVFTLLLFIILAFITVIRKTSIFGALIVACAIILTHMAYGIGFFKGIFVRRLSR
jgi:glycosyltransferase involved in cell wall biosynthesis